MNIIALNLKNIDTQLQLEVFYSVEVFAKVSLVYNPNTFVPIEGSNEEVYHIVRFSGNPQLGYSKEYLENASYTEEYEAWEHCQYLSSLVGSSHLN